MVTDSDRLAAIRQRVEMIGHLADHIRVLVVEDVPWLLDRLAEAEARAEKAERERDETVRRLCRVLESWGDQVFARARLDLGVGNA